MTTTIDFNLASGTIIDNQFVTDGVTISADQKRSDIDIAMIFDTNNVTGNDDDLAYTDRDGVLIISRDGDTSDADDSGRGGTITFDFADEVDLESIILLDGEGGAFFTAFDADGNEIGEVEVGRGSDNDQRVIDLSSLTGVSTLVAQIRGSGALDDLTFDSAGTPGDDPGDDPTPVIGEQTDGETGTLSTGQDLAVTLTTPTDFVGPDPFGISGQIGFTELGGDINLAFVIDSSGSTFFASSRVPGFGDENGDGIAGDLYDVQLNALNQLSQDLAAQGFAGQVNIALVPFGNSAASVFSFSAGVNVTTELANAGLLTGGAFGFPVGGGTNFEPPLQESINFFNSVDPTNTGTNQVFFLSDGQAPTNTLADELATLEDPNGINATIRAFGFGPGASEFDLDVIDSNGDAVISNDASVLADALVSTGTPADLQDVEILVNGVLEDTLMITDLTPNALGLAFDTQIDTAVSGDGQADLITARANTTSGESVEVSLYVGEIGSADTFDLVGPQDPVEFIFAFDGDEDSIAYTPSGALSTSAVDGDGDGDADDIALLDGTDTVVTLIDPVTFDLMVDIV